MLLCFDSYETQSRELADALNIPCHLIKQHRFPDGEVKLTLPGNLSGHTILCQSLDHPDEKLVALLLAAKTARQLGASELTLVAPYLCYMRQDKAFHPGEAVSQRIIGQFLADLFDNVISVDPHLHRTPKLQTAVPARRTMALSATGLMADFLAQKCLDKPVLLGPDSESGKWVEAVARPNQWEFGVCNKIRKGDRDVEITLPDIDLQGRAVVIVDDVASSGKTLAVACRECLQKQAAHVDVLVTHALFGGAVMQNLKRAGVRHIWSTDSVDHASNVIPLHGLLKSAVRCLLEK